MLVFVACFDSTRLDSRALPRLIMTRPILLAVAMCVFAAVAAVDANNADGLFADDLEKRQGPGAVEPYGPAWLSVINNCILLPKSENWG